MNISADDFRRHFALLSDEALLATDRNQLTEAARPCYDEEVTRRGLDETEDEAGDGGSSAGDTADAQPGMVVIATFAVPEEASLARGLLESASIPSLIATTYVAMGPADLRLMVPDAFVEQALEVLEFEMSDEELAAQAEAAGLPDDEEAAEEEESAEER